MTIHNPSTSSIRMTQSALSIQRYIISSWNTRKFDHEKFLDLLDEEEIVEDLTANWNVIDGIIVS